MPAIYEGRCVPRDDFAQAICAYGDAAQAFEQILRRGSASAPIDMASPRKDGEAMSKANRGPERARGLRDGDSRFNACSGAHFAGEHGGGAMHLDALPRIVKGQIHRCGAFIT